MNVRQKDSIDAVHASLPKSSLALLVLILMSPWRAEPSWAETGKSVTGLGWKHQSEASISLQRGNSDFQNVQMKQETSYFWPNDAFKSSGHLLQNIAGGNEVANTWDLMFRYERILSPLWALFTANSWEGNRFAGFRYRGNQDFGAKYYIIPGDRDKNLLLTEAGYRFSYQAAVQGLVPAYQNTHYVRFYFEGKKEIALNVVSRLWIELMPAISGEPDMLVNIEPSLSVSLSSHFSIKLAVLGNYNSHPLTPGKKSLDYQYTTSLMATY